MAITIHLKYVFEDESENRMHHFKEHFVFVLEMLNVEYKKQYKDVYMKQTKKKFNGIVPFDIVK
jgi:hypothetical protein